VPDLWSELHARWPERDADVARAGSDGRSTHGHELNRGRVLTMQQNDGRRAQKLGPTAQNALWSKKTTR
jgi:hypothetical protein